MSKRILAEKDKFNPKCTAEHLKLYASENFLTFDNEKINVSKIAKSLGFNRGTIIALLKGDAQKHYDSDTFSRIAKRTGIIKEYWMGITEQKTEVGYREEMFKEAQLKSKIGQLESIQDTQYDNEIAMYSNLFKSLGYTYECPDCCRYEGFPHILTNDATHAKTELTTTEINQLIQNLKETIAFACFKKGQATQQTEERENQNED